MFKMHSFHLSVVILSQFMFHIISCSIILSRANFRLMMSACIAKTQKKYQVDGYVHKDEWDNDSQCVPSPRLSHNKGSEMVWAGISMEASTEY